MTLGVIATIGGIMDSNSNNSLWKKLQRPKYRDAFIAENVGVQIASELRSLRTSRGKSQDQLAADINMNQATISQMENPEYRKYNIGSLIRFAQYYKVALDVRFVSLVDYVRRVATETPQALVPSGFGEPIAQPIDSSLAMVDSTAEEGKRQVKPPEVKWPARQDSNERPPDLNDLNELNKELYRAAS